MNEALLALAARLIDAAGDLDIRKDQCETLRIYSPSLQITIEQTGSDYLAKAVRLDGAENDFEDELLGSVRTSSLDDVQAQVLDWLAHCE